MLLITFAILLLIIYNLLDVYNTIICIYYFIVGSFGLIYNSKRDGKQVLELNTTKFNKFALMICAHDEKYVIQNTIEEMAKLDYPMDKLEVVVICDNCTDDTYDLAIEASKNFSNFHILKRTNNEKKGKPHAVKFGLDWIDANLEYDALSIADADNLYDKNFFLYMNDRLLSGSRIIQGYLGVKNPFDSFVTASITYSYYISTRYYFLARRYLKMPTTLGGTGFVVEKNIMKEIGWDMSSLVEDFEFSCKCVILGYDIDYCYEAKTFDEKPLMMSTSVKQRTRWMQGHFWVAKNYSMKLIKAFADRKTNKLGLFDYLAYMWSPFLYVAYVIILFIPFAIIAVGYEPTLLLNFFWIGIAIKFAFYFATKLLDFAFVLKEGYGIRNLWKCIYFYIFHTIDWIIATSRGLWLHNDQGKWDKTLHTRIGRAEDMK